MQISQTCRKRIFDKLGSTIVALGNNLATTEADIVAMGLRLAGAGKQVKLSEAQILSLSGALSSIGLEAEAGGSAFSKVMIEMQLAVETNSKKLSQFASVAGMSASDFKKAFETDAMGAIIAFIGGLSSAEERGVSAIKVLDDMGISEVRLRDALLRASGAQDILSTAVDIGTNAWEENNALTKEAEQRYATTASRLKILNNTVTDIRIEIGEKMLPAVQMLVDKLKEVDTQKIVDGFGWIIDNAKAIVGVLAAIAGSVVVTKIVAFVSAMVKVVGVISAAVAKSGGIAAIVTKAGAALSAAVAAIGGPITLVIAAVVALIGIIVALWTKNENFKKRND